MLCLIIPTFDSNPAVSAIFYSCNAKLRQKAYLTGVVFLTLLDL